MSQHAPRTVIVLAAGKGTRMKSDLPKVLFPLLGRTLVGHVLSAATAVDADRTAVVVGHCADAVGAHAATIVPHVIPVLQAQQNGTGHAVRIACEALPGLTGTVLVLNGDVPLLRAETVVALLHAHEQAGAAASVLAAEVDNPFGLGRIIRNAAGQLEQIVEERDATDAQRQVREINAGIYAFDAAHLVEQLGKISANNDQGEEYLTDVLGQLVVAGEKVLVHVVADAEETLGANDRAQLADLRRRMRDRINTAWMRSGVSILDPQTTWIDVTATIGPDATIEANTQLYGETHLAAGAQIGPDVTLIDTTVGERATVIRTHATSAQIGDEVSVGPFAYLRPGSVLGRKSKIGTFVETKNTELGVGAKVPHLSYIGDATIGEGTNVGAATVTVNYDGVAKHRTEIGKHARTGADNMFVAPVRVGDGAYTAAGSVIVNDVPPGALGVARGQQRNIDGWVPRRRAGTAAAEAAALALESESSAADSGRFAADE